MGVFFPEDLMDLLGMLVVLGENNGLTQFFAVVDTKTVLHQNVQDLTNGILVEHPLVDGRGGDGFRQFPVFILKGVLVRPLILLGQIVVHDSLLDEFQLAFHRHEIHQIPVGNCLTQLVAVGGNAVLQLEDLVGVLVDLILGRGGQTHQRGVKVVKNILILVVNGAVRLVHHQEIKVTDRKEFLFVLVLDGVNAVHHGLVGGEHTAGIVVALILTKIGHGQVREHIHEGALRLSHQRISIRKEQDVLHPAVIQQYLAQSNDGSRLARARGHDEKRLAAVLFIKGLAYGLDGALLIVAACDILVHHDVLEARPHGVQVEELFQIPLGVDGSHTPLGMVFIIPYMSVKAVGEENDGAAAVLLL